MPCRLGVPLAPRSGELVADDIEAPELVHHRHCVWDAFRFKVNNSTFWEERSPLLSRVELVPRPAVELERDLLALDAQSPAFRISQGQRRGSRRRKVQTHHSRSPPPGCGG